MTFFAVILVSTTLIGCETLNKAGLVRAGIDLPNPAPQVAAPCRVPTVDKGDDARLSLAQHRLALVTCKKRHKGMVNFYNDVRRTFGGEQNK